MNRFLCRHPGVPQTPPKTPPKKEGQDLSYVARSERAVSWSYRSNSLDEAIRSKPAGRILFGAGTVISCCSHLTVEKSPTQRFGIWNIISRIEMVPRAQSVSVTQTYRCLHNICIVSQDYWWDHHNPFPLDFQYTHSASWVSDEYVPFILGGIWYDAMWYSKRSNTPPIWGLFKLFKPPMHGNIGDRLLLGLTVYHIKGDGIPL